MIKAMNVAIHWVGRRRGWLRERFVGRGARVRSVTRVSLYAVRKADALPTAPS